MPNPSITYLNIRSCINNFLAEHTSDFEQCQILVKLIASLQDELSNTYEYLTDGEQEQIDYLKKIL